MSDAAVANLVSGIVTVTTLVIGFLTIWIKIKYGVENKIDTNAVLTETRNVALSEQLNGKLEGRITLIVKSNTDPIIAELKLHTENDEKNSAEIKKVLDMLMNRMNC